MNQPVFKRFDVRGTAPPPCWTTDVESLEDMVGSGLSNFRISEVTV